MSKRTAIILAIGTLAASFAATAAEASPSQVRSVPGAPQATCNYMVWVAGGVNVHADMDRRSRILRHFHQYDRLNGLPCGNQEGGAYASCNSGTLWKSYALGWIPTKCLTRI
ncbi:hypothetical protein ACIBEJ_02905 [Nonomuraea sp. NPDC050790]|uniref:hypothetical protein n=1 Tax=Nonomuraea sp. NPDC050790 TaxID=3364371 RepID=UPI00378F4FCC